MKKTVVVLATERKLLEYIRAAVEQWKSQLVIVTTGEAFTRALDFYFPVLGVIDLTAEKEWYQTIQRCKLRPHTKQIPIHLLDNQEDQSTAKTAAQAGVDQYWGRYAFIAQINQVVGSYIKPKVIYCDGWDDELSDAARLGIEEFNRGDYFEQHEYFEAAWIAEQRAIRELYQGILQIGLAFLQIERGNWQGAIKMFRRGLPKLRTLPTQSQGIDIGTFRATAEALHEQLTALGPERLDEFDQSQFPMIHYEAKYV